jgi:hypothetical protein
MSEPRDAGSLIVIRGTNGAPPSVMGTPLCTTRTAAKTVTVLEGFEARRGPDFDPRSFPLWSGSGDVYNAKIDSKSVVPITDKIGWNKCNLASLVVPACRGIPVPVSATSGTRSYCDDACLGFTSTLRLTPCQNKNHHTTPEPERGRSTEYASAPTVPGEINPRVYPS